MTQLAFDFEIEVEPAVDRGFPDMQTPEAGGLCSRCGHKLKGRYAHVHGALRDGLWFAWCDPCTDAAQGIHPTEQPEPEPHSSPTTHEVTKGSK